MPYEYKKKQDCKQKSGDKGAYVTKKKGAAHQKCWKSEEAFKNSAAARHVHELDEGQPTDPGPSPGKAGASNTPKVDQKNGPKGKVKVKESLLRKIIRGMLLEEQLGGILEIMPSDVEGMGVFATTEIPTGTDLGTAHIQQPGGGYHVTELGHFHNHSYEPNCTNVMKNGTRNIFASRNIFPYEEITVDYTEQPDLEQPKSDWK